MIKKIFMVAVLLISGFGVQSVFAQADEKTVEELFTVMKIKEQFEETMSMMMGEQQKIFAGQKNADKVINIMNEFTKKYMSWDAFKTDVIKVYQETFTQEELQGMISFYKTPLGQSLIKKEPQVQKKVMVLTIANMQKNMPELQKSIMESMKQEKKQEEAAKQINNTTAQ